MLLSLLNRPRREVIIIILFYLNYYKRANKRGCFCFLLAGTVNDCFSFFFFLSRKCKINRRVPVNPSYCCLAIGFGIVRNYGLPDNQPNTNPDRISSDDCVPLAAIFSA